MKSMSLNGHLWAVSGLLPLYIAIIVGPSAAHRTLFCLSDDFSALDARNWMNFSEGVPGRLRHLLIPKS